MKFFVPITIVLSEEQQEEIRKKINLLYLGDEDCNHMVNGKMVAKYPNKETEEFSDAHYDLGKHYGVMATVDFCVKTGRPKKIYAKKIC